MDARTDEELMAAYVAGEERAFRELFERWAPTLLGMVRRQVRDEAESKDLVQQTFLQLHRARNDFRVGARLKPWLLTIGMNLVRERHRRRGRRKEASLEDEGVPEPKVDPPEFEEADVESATRLRAALDALPDAQREVIELHWFQELPFAEVARIVGASETAVKVRAHRGYEKLRASLADVARNRAREGV